MGVSDQSGAGVAVSGGRESVAAADGARELGSRPHDVISTAATETTPVRIQSIVTWTLEQLRE
jgi:hypothetical protein